MKKLVFVTVMIILAAACGPRQPAEQEAEQSPGPVLQTGNLLGHHVFTFEPAPGVTTDQLIDFGKNKYFFEAEKHFPGLKGYVLKGRTGECVDCISHLVFFESTGIRDKYWKADGSYTEVGEAASEKMQPVMEEMSQLTEFTYYYTDWEIIGDTGAPGPVLQSGNVLGIHVASYELAPGVTEDEWINFFKEKWHPEFEMHFEGARVFLLRGLRGEYMDQMGTLFYFESVEVRDKYWKEDGSYTELGQAAFDKMQPISEKANELAEWSSSYTDWMIL